ncbi:hypothetical protein J6590_076512 [Homalodisca vitripennis]|nr:hypothetical protein J6590_076512 [Homalodisca vitripennis]
MNFTPFGTTFTAGALPAGHQFTTAKFAQQVGTTAGGQVVGLLSSDEQGVTYLRPVDTNGAAFTLSLPQASGNNSQHNQIIALPINVPSKPGDMAQQQTLQIQVVNPANSAASGGEKYSLPLTLQHFQQGQGCENIVVGVIDPNSISTSGGIKKGCDVCILVVPRFAEIVKYLITDVSIHTFYSYPIYKMASAEDPHFALVEARRYKHLGKKQSLRNGSVTPLRYNIQVSVMTLFTIYRKINSEIAQCTVLRVQVQEMITLAYNTAQGGTDGHSLHLQLQQTDENGEVHQDQEQLQQHEQQQHDNNNTSSSGSQTQPMHCEEMVSVVPMVSGCGRGGGTRLIQQSRVALSALVKAPVISRQAIRWMLARLATSILASVFGHTTTAPDISAGQTTEK